MELSRRLYAVASLVTEGASVADIGTDHGYIPIYLVQQGIASKVIALDVNGGPLERARMHIIGNNLKGKIETRLSDGLHAVEPGEVDTIVAAGMGGGSGPGGPNPGGSGPARPGPGCSESARSTARGGSGADGGGAVKAPRSGGGASEPRPAAFRAEEQAGEGKVDAVCGLAA